MDDSLRPFANKLVEPAIVETVELHGLHLEREKSLPGNALPCQMLAHHVQKGRLPATTNPRNDLDEVSIPKGEKLVKVLLTDDHESPMRKICISCKFLTL